MLIDTSLAVYIIASPADSADYKDSLWAVPVFRLVSFITSEYWHCSHCQPFHLHLGKHNNCSFGDIQYYW